MPETLVFPTKYSDASEEAKVMRKLLGGHDAATAVHRTLAERGIFSLVLVGAPGSGKTALLERTVEILKDEMQLAVIEGDICSQRDANRIARYGVPVVQINTEREHLEAEMIEKALLQLDLEGLDLLLIENIGSLVCPPRGFLGEDEKVAVLSVEEGNDIPFKYRNTFSDAALTLLNKSELLPYTDFDVYQAVEDIKTLHEKEVVLSVSAYTGEGMVAWLDWLRARVKEQHRKCECQEGLEPEAKIAVLGLGNIIRRDDGLGVRVVEYLAENYQFPDDVELLDGGILGVELLRFITPGKRLLLLDAIHGGNAPGTMYRLPEKEIVEYFKENLPPYESGMQDVLALLPFLGRSLPEMVMLGAEPFELNVGLELSADMSQMVPVLASCVLSELHHWGVDITYKKRMKMHKHAS